MSRTPYLFPLGSRLGVDNLVLRARATHHHVEDFAGPCSIKTVGAGEVAWKIQGRPLVVDPASFLVISDGERYSMNIAAEKPVETCCVFFATGFVEQLARDLTSPLDQALEPTAAAPVIPYLSALHTDADRSTVRRVRGLAQRCAQALAPSSFEEEFVDLAADVLRLYESIRRQGARLPAARRSTREELYRRVLLGREFFHAHGSGPVSLAAASKAAGLSLYHFHRSFTQAFEQTPHSYLTQLRLARARRLLESGASVLDASLDVGFASPSAFSRLFRGRYGEPPSAVRRKLARSGRKQG